MGREVNGILSDKGKMENWAIWVKLLIIKAYNYVCYLLKT